MLDVNKSQASVLRALQLASHILYRCYSKIESMLNSSSFPNICATPRTRKKYSFQWFLVAALTICIGLLIILIYNRNVTIRIGSLHGSSEEKNKGFDMEISKLCSLQEPKHVKTRNNNWYVMLGQRRDEEISVYGAYLDTRPNIGSNQKIRLFGVSIGRHNTSVYCQIWYDSGDSAYIVEADITEAGRGVTISGIFYMEHLYSCKIPQGKGNPQKASLSFLPCSVATSVLAVVIPNKPSELFDIGVCVAVAYGYLLPKRLVEWIEVNKILGVSQINVYESQVNIEAHAVFQHYQKAGFVITRQVNSPVPSTCVWCQKLATIAILNDCMYRNVYTYKYIMVIDFDEFVIPQKSSHYTITSALHDLEDGRGQPPAFMLRNAYFFLEFKPEETQDSRLISTQYQTRLDASEMGYASKSIINPNKCVAMQNHFCTLRTPDVGAAWSVAIDPGTILINHYKHCHYERQQCHEALKEPIKDNTILKYAKDLINAFNTTVAELKIR